MSSDSNDLFDNDDLLSILNSDTSSKGDLEDAIADADEEEQNRKLEEIKALSSKMGSTSSVENPGSGNIDDDLVNWLDGVDKLPSSPLNQYVSNASLKMDYGLTRQTLHGYALASKLNQFLDEVFPMLFDSSVVLTLTPAELEERVKLAFAMRKELYNQNGRTVLSLKDAKARGAEVDDVDQLRMLLSSIPSDKLSAVLKEWSK